MTPRPCNHGALVATTVLLTLLALYFGYGIWQTLVP